MLRQWTDKYAPEIPSLDDIIRFNEAIDQAVAESVTFSNEQVDQARNLLLGMLGHDMLSPTLKKICFEHVSGAGGRFYNSVVTLETSQRCATPRAEREMRACQLFVSAESHSKARKVGRRGKRLQQWQKGWLIFGICSPSYRGIWQAHYPARDHEEARCLRSTRNHTGSYEPRANPAERGSTYTDA